MLTTDRTDPLHWIPGVLDRHASRPGIVMVPDLARLSLPAARAAVALVGADAAHLESSRQSSTWHPRDRWLATLHRQDVGTVSPHLLDRFSVRVDAVNLESRLRGQRMLTSSAPSGSTPSARDGAPLSLPRPQNESRCCYPPAHLASAVTWRWPAWPGPPVPGGPYPEDDAMPRRVANPLRFGWQRGKTGPARGHPIGTHPARP